MINLKSFGQLVVVCSILLSNPVFAQTEKLFLPVDEKTLSADAAKKAAEIKQRHKSKFYGLFRFKNSVLEAKSFVLNVPDGRVVTMQRRSLEKNPTHISYSALSEEEQVHLTLVLSGNTGFGTLFTQFGNYTI